MLTVMVPAPKMAELSAGVVVKSRSFNVPAFNKATGSTDTEPPVDAFSVTVGLVAVCVRVGASLRAEILIVMVFGVGSRMTPPLAVLPVSST